MTDVPNMDEIRSMTPQQASEALAAMSAAAASPAPPPSLAPAAITPTAPTSSAEASAKLAALTSDQAFRERLLNSDTAATKLFHELTKAVAAGGDDVEIAMSGVLPDLPSSELRMMADAAKMLRDKGFSPRAIRETLDDKPPTQGDIDIATASKNQYMRSPEFAKRFLAGEPDEAMRMLAANAILSKIAEK